MSLPHSLRAWTVRLPVPVFAFVSIALSGCARESAPPSVDGGPAEVLFSEAPPSWFEAYFTSLDVAPDGRRAVFDSRRLVDLTEGTDSPIGVIDAVDGGTFDDAGRLVVRGRRGEDVGWFRAGDSGGEATLLPSLGRDGSAVWSASGRSIAHAYRSGDDGTVRIASPEDGGPVESYALPGALLAFAWLPGDTTLLVLVSEEGGLSSLHTLDRAGGRTRLVTDGLDGPWAGAALAVSEDGRFTYLALASPGVPDPEARHVPDVDRDLDIYRIDLASGERSPVVQTPAEELAPAFEGGSLYWVSLETREEAVIVPFEGGQARVVAENVEGPTWRPDGRAIGVTTGGWRLVDWALNLDGGVVEIDPDGNPTGPVTPIITGYHEDFSPVWSPDGSWIAYHSHRSPTPVAAYSGQGSADDIFVRRPDAPTREEIRLTDFGWEVGTPDWAPDGRRLIMTSWNRDAGDEGPRASAWVIEMDPRTGVPVGRTRIPAPPEAHGTPATQAWSPARDEIAITFAGPGPNQAELWILEPDGSSAHRVLTYTGHQYGGVDWSADGEAIIYSALVDGHQQLFSVPRTGGEPQQLTSDPENLFHPQVSPDGRWVAASRIQTVRRILRRPVATNGGS